MTAVDVRPAADPGSWAHAARLLFGYHRETAVEVGAPQPRTPEEVWFPVRRETIDPASVHSTYLVAYEQGRPVGGIVLVAHDALSVLLKRCYVPPAQRRRGVATALVATAGDLAADRGATRLVLDVLPSRAGAIAAWRRMGFAEAPPWGDPAMAYFERPVADGRARPWLGLPYRQVALWESDPRWAQVFAHHAEVLRRDLADVAIAIEHVGSTAVQDLAAKPIVDIAVLARTPGVTPTTIRVLADSGYQFQGDKGDDGGWLFVGEDQPGRRIVHVHLVAEGDGQWGRYLAVRDRLRSDPEARRAYAAAKRELARRFPADRGAYTAAKAPMLETLVGTACPTAPERQ